MPFCVPSYVGLGFAGSSFYHQHQIYFKKKVESRMLVNTTRQVDGSFLSLLVQLLLGADRSDASSMATVYFLLVGLLQGSSEQCKLWIVRVNYWLIFFLFVASFMQSILPQTNFQAPIYTLEIFTDHIILQKFYDNVL